jgi:tetratricopeptide (TPR) repeat protein
VNLLKRFLARVIHSLGTLRRFHALASHRRRDFLATERLFTRALALDGTYKLARFNRGVLRWRELDNWAGAIADFSTLLAQDAAYVDALFNRAMALARSGNFHAAVDDFATFLKIAPESRWARHAAIQLQNLQAVLDDLSRQLPPPPQPPLIGP